MTGGQLSDGLKTLGWLGTQTMFGGIEQNEQLLLERKPEAHSVDYAHLVFSVSHHRVLLIRKRCYDLSTS